MNVIIQTFATDWKSEISITQHDGWTTAMITVDSDKSIQATTNGLKYMYDLLTKERKTLIRSPMETISEQDFETKIWHHRGIARVIFQYTPGTHQLINQDVTIPGFNE